MKNYIYSSKIINSIIYSQNYNYRGPSSNRKKLTINKGTVLPNIYKTYLFCSVQLVASQGLKKEENGCPTATTLKKFNLVLQISIADGLSYIKQRTNLLKVILLTISISIEPLSRCEMGNQYMMEIYLKHLNSSKSNTFTFTMIKKKNLKKKRTWRD